MLYLIEYFGDFAERPEGKIYGDVHDVMEVLADDLADAEERCARRLVERFGHRFEICGAVGLSGTCLHCV